MGVDGAGRSITGVHSPLEDPMNLGAPEIVLIILAVLLLFGYKKLPDASRSIGRSLRIFKGEMKGMKDDDVRVKDAATTTPVRGEVVTPAAPAAGTASADLPAQLIEEARLAEARAAELRARANQARTAEGPR
jgi:sec-independent protein translocase protein TatA